MKEIPLTRGQVAFVDDDDYHAVRFIRWAAGKKVMKCRDHFYATHFYRDHEAAMKVKAISMHVFLMRPPAGMEVDHIDGNGLNNCRHNLRICTVTENRRNKRPHGDRKYKGISKAYVQKKTGLQIYYAYIYLNQRLVRLGSFTSEEEAALSYDNAAREHFGEFAFCNFSQEAIAIFDDAAVVPLPSPANGHGKKSRRGKVAA